MADRWKRKGPDLFLLVRKGQVWAVGAVCRSIRNDGTWCGHVSPNLLFDYFPTRSAAMRAVMVEAASNKRCKAV